MGSAGKAATFQFKELQDTANDRSIN